MTSREEIAKKLREIGEEMGDIEDCYETVFEEIDAIIYNSSYDIFFQRLADIVDLTCKLKIQDGHACCGNCGHRLAGEYEGEEDHWCFRPYCPDCGARVMDDDS